MPYRVISQTAEDAERQAALSGALGGRLLWTARVGRAELGLRYDLRLSPYQHDAKWTSLWHHGLAMGLTSAR